MMGLVLFWVCFGLVDSLGRLVAGSCPRIAEGRVEYGTDRDGEMGSCESSPVRYSENVISADTLGIYFGN
jgi:hypothetical protein